MTQSLFRSRGICTLKASGQVAWAAAAAYLALLVGRAVPADVGFLGAPDLFGEVKGQPLTLRVLDKAREQSITSVFSSM
jgi:hypothetical protein